MNKSLVYPEKPNNIGIYLGQISSFNLNKGHITLSISEPIEIGDTISIETEKGTYTVSEKLPMPKGTDLFGTQKMNKDKNYQPHQTVTLGRMKGNFRNGLKVYKMSSKALDNLAESTYLNKENIKIPLKCEINMHLNTPIKILISTLNTDDSFYNNINFEITSKIIPELALKSPITEDRVKSQFMKTANTPYEFKEIIINMDNNLYIPHIADINNLRRICLEKLENIIINKYCSKHSNFVVSSDNTLNDKNLSTTINNQNSINTYSNSQIAILLNKLNLDYNYSLLKNVDRIYIPLKYFINLNYSNIIKILSKKFEIYIYLPTIMRNYYKKMFYQNMEKILSSYNIKGFVISNLGNLNMLKELNLQNKSYNLIGNYTLNVFNNYTTNELKNLGINIITLSPELNEFDFTNFIKNFNSELIVYGKLPLMNINYCPLSKRNKCLKDCKKFCMQNKKYYLVDRLNFKFEIIPDFGDCITTLYNSKTLSIKPPEQVSSLRLDFIYENIDEINNIINSVKSGNKLEGSNFTNGNWHREI